MKLIDLEEPYKVEIELNGHKCSISVIGKLVDAIPVVRCKDCIYYREGLCDRLKYSHVTNADSFCSEGERKDG